MGQENEVGLKSPEVQIAGDYILIQSMDKAATRFLVYGHLAEESQTDPLEGEFHGTGPERVHINGLTWKDGRPKACTFSVVAYNKDGDLRSEEVKVEWQGKTELVSVAKALDSAAPTVESKAPPTAPDLVPIKTDTTPAPPAITDTPKSGPASGSDQASDQAPAEQRRLLSDVLTDKLTALEKEIDAALKKIKKTRAAPTEIFIEYCTKKLEGIEDQIGRLLKKKPEMEKVFEPVNTQKEGMALKLLELIGLKEKAETKAKETIPTLTPPTPPKNPDRGGDPREAIRLAVQASTPPPVSQPAETHPQTTPTPQEDLTGRVGTIENKVARLEEELSKKASKKDLEILGDQLGNQMKKGFEEVITRIKPAKLPASSDTTSTTSPPPIIQNFHCQHSPRNGGADSGSGAVVGSGTATDSLSRGHSSTTKQTQRKDAKWTICFLVFALSLVAIVGLIMALYFHADRSTTLDAGRMDTSETKAKAQAEIEGARQLQMEIMEKYRANQQELEGLRRQIQKAPEPTVQPTTSKTNVVEITMNHKFIHRVVDESEVVVLPPRQTTVSTYEMTYWSPTPMMNRYSYQ